MKLTPGMKQYMDQKEKYPDCIILFRMGDFYETFYDDAKICSKVLGITLTGRGKGETRAPLAGIPFHALDNYLTKLVNAGYKVAICEQLEDPKKAKGLVKRGVIRVVTPGTVIDNNYLDNTSNNYIASIFMDGDNIGFSVCDLSTGDFQTTEFKTYDNLLNEIAKFQPSEVIVSNDNDKLEAFCSYNKIFYNKLPITKFWINSTTGILLDHFKISSLRALGLDKKDLCVCASGSLLSYLYETQMTKLNHISNLKYYKRTDYMTLDNSTIRNLELLKNLMDQTKRGSLLSILDKTTTSMGGRLLKSWITRPLIKKEQIDERLDKVESFFNDRIFSDDVENILKEVDDIERLIGRVEYGTSNAKDLYSLKTSLDKVPHLISILSQLDAFKDSLSVDTMDSLREELERAVKEDAPTSVREGGMIKRGFNKELDDLYEVKDEGSNILFEIEQRLKEETQIPSLKIGYNRVFGYYVEVTKKYKDQVPPTFIRKQTLTNYERYITEELKEKEEIILSAAEKIVDLEYRIFSSLVELVKDHTKNIQIIAREIAKVDCSLSFAKISLLNNYIKPIVDDGFDFKIIEARHPVIETMVDQYISNSCEFNNDKKMHIITGPNMSGKSSFMRQNALCSLMAQIGCFVPATSANISIVDRIFTRVGAYDDLSSGQSTFMVEMNETANIINNATSRSLVILDEIGRGTSTYDGISLAWSIAEYILTKIGAKCLFATHYHQMNKLSDKHKGVENFNILVEEVDDKVVFLHKVVAGGTDKSYGIEVAKLAGLPKELIDNARDVMAKLEFEDEIADQLISENKDIIKEKSKGKRLEPKSINLDKFIKN